MFFCVANINDFSDAEIESALSQMPQQQCEHIAKKKQIVSKKQSIVSRILLKNLLLEVFGISDGYNIEFDHNLKPFYSNSKDVYISISHSGNYASAVVSNKPVGIDIQVPKAASDKLIKMVCTKDELEFINATDKKSFYKIWTIKEAYSKCSCVKLMDVFKLSFVKGNTVCGFDKTLHSVTTDAYELSIIE